VRAERAWLAGAERDIAGREERLRKVEDRQGTLIDLAAGGTITREDLRGKLAGLDMERDGLRRELAAARDAEGEAEALRELPTLAEGLARDLPHLLDRRPAVSDYDTVAAERTEENPLGLYTLTPERIRYLGADEKRQRERRAEDERAARYRAAYEDLSLRVVAHSDGTLEASWKVGEAVLRTRSDKSVRATR
jgi:hypothetical protein